MNASHVFAGLFALFTIINTGAAADHTNGLADPLVEGTLILGEANPAETQGDAPQHARNDLSQGNLDPGHPPEGDFIGGIAFTPDGERIFATNRMRTPEDDYVGSARKGLSVGYRLEAPDLSLHYLDRSAHGSPVEERLCIAPGEPNATV